MSVIYTFLGSLPTINCMPRDGESRLGSDNYGAHSRSQGDGTCDHLGIAKFSRIRGDIGHGLGRRIVLSGFGVAYEHLSGKGSGIEAEWREEDSRAADISYGLP